MKFLTLCAGVMLFTQAEHARILTETSTPTVTKTVSLTSKPIDSTTQVSNISANIKTLDTTQKVA